MDILQLLAVIPLQGEFGGKTLRIQRERRRSKGKRIWLLFRRM
jgi:hypothetical protein